jgi:hypothetical protein
MEHLHFRKGHKPLANAPALGRLDQTIVDARGRAGSPIRAYDTLAALYRNGAISNSMLQAGRDFEELFARCQLDPLRSPDMERTPGLSQGGLADSVVANRNRLWKALEGLGGITAPAGSCCWEVLGGGMTLKAYAERSVLREGVSLNEHAAKGVLVAALSILDRRR